jgi:uncharacterized short protein YbdD (DUF466 family)
MRRFSFKAIWQGLRRMIGEDAYDRYLAHWRTHAHHAGERPLDRKAFYAQSLERKWNGVRRCC